MQVLFDHDGAIDDLLSLMLLLASPDIELAGVVVTPADCYLGPSLSATQKILRFFERDSVEVCAGDLHGVNAFPREWRKAPYAVDALPILNDCDADLRPVGGRSGRELIIRVLDQASEPITILITGPVSNVCAALDTHPHLARNVQEVVWMGGALHVPGNVQDYEHDGSAEWNAYWDPPASARFLELGLPLTLFPLDVTNDVPVSREFLLRLARQRRYPLSDLAGQTWAMTVGTFPAYEHVYHMWDTLCAGYLSFRDVVHLRPTHCSCIPHGPSAGRIRECDRGPLIQVAECANVQRFHDHVLTLLRRP